MIPRDDPAWPKDCNAILWRVANLPHAIIPTSSAFPSIEAAKEVAEKDCGGRLMWEARPKEGDFRSNRLPYKDGYLYYEVWS